MPGGIIAIFILFAIAVIIGSIFSHKKEKERKAMLARWAHASGLSFSPQKLHGFENAYPLDCFRQGDGGQYAYNLSRGQRGGMEMFAGDYHYYTESRDSDGGTDTTHHHFSFVMFLAPFPLRQMTIRKEGFFDKFGAAFGFDDIDFESAEFSKAFHVKCEDRRWAYDVIHPRTMELLLRHRGLRFESNSRCLVAFNSDRWGIPQFEHHANAATELLDGIPKHARERQHA